ncbi:galactose mutarotase [Alteromonas sp. ASW11-19]|uniref:Aldose 1-epimerase n=1 Tax=Alteromonas salexigens TaxID=2982530 RepID=A0ABT2VN20_9ALTE|nr:aldose epimerase family protein [Alteromonas salexigens]MCU7554707.1 galactose mutarotase [Alteromonas salexigens]
MHVSEIPFGSVNDQSVFSYKLENDAGMTAEILTYGGIIRTLQVPDNQGNPHQCVNGFATLDEYLADSSYQGALVGRYANRIGEGHFTLDGQTYQVDVNGGPHHLHGGFKGFNQQLWSAKKVTEDNAVGVELSLESPAGDGGFPGKVTVVACYRLHSDNTLSLSLYAETTAATPFSMTQHAYFTLGNQRGVHGQQLHVNADGVTDADASLLPTGALLPVADTPFDFRMPTRIANNLVSGCQLFDQVGGYDHNFALNNTDEPAASLYAPDTGIHMSLSTSFPGLQVYSGNIVADEGMGAICLEPQYFPDSPNQPEFPDCILRPGAPRREYIRYRFTQL